MDEAISSEFDWRQQHKSLGQQLWYMYQFEIETDLEINLYADEIRKSYRCHKLIFLRLSSIFQKLIKGYDKVEGEVCCISLSPVKTAAFEIIIRYAYTDKLELSSLTDALEIIEFCISYDILNLKALCEDYISKFELSSDSVWEIMDNPVTGKKLHSKINKILSEKTVECIQSPKFLLCCQSSLLRFLSMERLNVESELQLVQAAIQWAKVQNRGVDLDPQSSKKLLGPCLEKLRLLSLTPKEFSKNLANSGLFSSDDALKLLINITTPGAMEMPPGVCTNTTLRNAAAAASPVAEMLKLEIGEENNRLHQVDEKKRIICIRGSLHGQEKLKKMLKAPAKLEVVEFKVNYDMLLIGLKIFTQMSSKTKSSYTERMHVSVRQANGMRKIVAHHTHIAPVSYGPGFFDVVFSKPGALKAGELYVIEVCIKSHGLYLCKPRSNFVQFQHYEFTFSADTDRFPFSNILLGLLLEH